MMKNIYTGIVTYNPDISKLSENIDSIYSQANQTVIFDNGSYNQNDILKLIKKYDNVELIASATNIGIASALNQLMQWGYEMNYSWMLSLDQDSVCEHDYVSKMKDYLDIEPNIGIVAPVIYDKNVGVIGHNPVGNYSHVNTCITSGAFTSIKKWMEIGGYDDSMFIDSVDFEFCYRMRKKGYGVIQTSASTLLHELGDSEKKRFLFWSFRLSSHSAFRDYYIARNNIYYPLKHNLYLRVIRGNFRNIKLLVQVLLYEQEKKNKVNSILRGWIDSYKTKLK
ncbi:EpsQ protein [Streptococcus equinus]|uniref:glycosyltransferase family 2 protein n=1 Tax=Streptococcus equinus TaxID=1335 RepID=UPI000F6F2D91|nr:glycosyltransferase family 2 protein [Streptococcus equinus]VED91394.1 EpsQ protein [Streptococcus equinus]VTS85134.1 EpsQ protein [Streptococcus equinus]